MPEWKLDKSSQAASSSSSFYTEIFQQVKMILRKILFRKYFWSKQEEVDAWVKVGYIIASWLVVITQNTDDYDPDDDVDNDEDDEDDGDIFPWVVKV